jgi:POT family proton-dependent oligopeptide transporter
LGAIVLFFYFASDVQSFNDYISAAIYAISIALPVFIITDRGLTSVEKCRIGVIYIIALFVIFFWSAFEQAGSSLTIFADTQVDRTIGDFEFRTTWFQSVNPIVVVVFAPLMALLWEFLGKRHLEPASPVKQAIGLTLLAIGYIVIAVAVKGVEPGTKISMFWLLALYFIHTIGELSLSPIGLSMVNKLSPARLASLLMGVWFMSNAASNILAGKLAALLPTGNGEVQSFMGYQIANLADFFMLFAIMAGVAAVILFCLCPLLKKMMKGIE